MYVTERSVTNMLQWSCLHSFQIIPDLDFEFKLFIKLRKGLYLKVKQINKGLFLLWNFNKLNCNSNERQ